MKALFHEGHEFDWVTRIDVAVEVIADQFAFDAELKQHVLKSYPDGHLRHSQIVTLCAAWPDTDVVGEVYRHAKRGGIRSFSSPDLFYAVVFARCPVASIPTHLKEAVESHVARRQMYTEPNGIGSAETSYAEMKTHVLHSAKCSFPSFDVGLSEII